MITSNTRSLTQFIVDAIRYSKRRNVVQLLRARRQQSDLHVGLRAKNDFIWTDSHVSSVEFVRVETRTASSAI